MVFISSYHSIDTLKQRYLNVEDPHFHKSTPSPNVILPDDFTIPVVGANHDDVIKWKQFPRNWPFVRGIPRMSNMADGIEDTADDALQIHPILQDIDGSIAQLLRGLGCKPKANIVEPLSRDCEVDILQECRELVFTTGVALYDEQLEGHGIAGKARLELKTGEARTAWRNMQVILLNWCCTYVVWRKKNRERFSAAEVCILI